MCSAIRVLYAEDDPRDADLTKTHFAEDAPDFEIEIVDTGSVCLDRLLEAEFDLLLLDNHLPDMDGLDVVRALVHADLQLPVVMVTGVGDEDLVVRALRLGAANYVPKQGNYLETLPDVLRDALISHRQGQGQGLLAVSAPRKILYVEHQKMDVELTLRHFAEEAPHFTVDVVDTCAEALTQLERPHAYDLALIDLRMPDLTGLDFAREARRRHLRLPPFIMISGKGDDAAAIATLNLGAADYVSKREGYLDKLVYAIDHAIAFDQILRLNEQLQAELAERTKAEQEIQRQAEQLRRTVEGAVMAMSQVVETRDPYTAGHERRVSELVTAIARDMAMDDEQLATLRIGALIHDVGKIGVPAEILAKPGLLSEVEFHLIKQHPAAGFDILATIDFGLPVAEMVLQHHERLDGSGYPRNLAGDDIRLEARILAVADVVEAMSSHRPYRAALGLETALREINEHAGIKYDADVVAACGHVFARGFTFTEA